jgi:hypothetical protein
MPITLEDTTQVMFLAMFGKRWPYPCREATTPGTRTYTIYPNGGTHTWPVTHTQKVAAVCKMWHAKIKEHLQLQLCWTAAHIHESAVDRALKMCNIDYYKDHWNFPEIPRVSTSYSYLYLDEEQVFSVTFTRRRVAHSAEAGVSQFSPAHELLAQYRGPEEPGKIWPVYTIEIPRVCWVPASVISDEARTEYQAWHPAQLEALRQWLAVQYAELLL